MQASVMRLVDEGAIQKNAKVAPLVDTFLTRANGTTLGELWGSNSTSSE